jgi:hypothetical protein
MLSMSDHSYEDIEAEETAEESESEPEIEARSEADMVVVPSLIPFPGKLDLDGNISTKRKKFKRTWDNYEIASGLSGKDKTAHRNITNMCRSRGNGYLRWFRV